VDRIDFAHLRYFEAVAQSPQTTGLPGKAEAVAQSPQTTGLPGKAETLYRS